MNFVIKVCDFGLSQTINPSKEYFREEDKALKLPFKWMAPESLDEGVFSTKSDVVSYYLNDFEINGTSFCVTNISLLNLVSNLEKMILSH